MPADPGPSRWVIPSPESADAYGMVGIGADLEASTLVDAYRNGIFPWPHEGAELPWFSPDPRGVVWPDRVRVSRSLRGRLRTSGWTTTVDQAFDEVTSACAAPRSYESGGTWVTPEMRVAYSTLHRLGWAHSLEVWDGYDLVGGLYGVQLGGMFTGESMFHRSTDASKVAFVDLADRLCAAGGVLIDVQLVTAHLVSLGAEPVPRSEFLRLLRTHRDDAVVLATDRREVSRLVR